MPADPLPSSAPTASAGVRVSDADRNAMVRRLADHAAAGRLTLDELEHRSSTVLAATTRGDLDAVAADLPADVATAAGAESDRRRRKPTRWVVSLMGAADKRGRWRVGRRLNVIAVMGGNDLDLRHAELDADDVTIVALAIMGGIDIYLPDSIEVDVGGFAVMGGNGEEGSIRPPRESAPRIRVLAYSVMGGVDVWRLPDEARGASLREARKLAKRTTSDPAR